MPSFLSMTRSFGRDGIFARTSFVGCSTVMLSAVVAMSRPFESSARPFARSVFSRNTDSVPFLSILWTLLAPGSVKSVVPSGIRMGPSLLRSPSFTIATFVPAATTPGMAGATVSVAGGGGGAAPRPPWAPWAYIDAELSAHNMTTKVLMTVLHSTSERVSYGRDPTAASCRRATWIVEVLSIGPGRRLRSQNAGTAQKRGGIPVAGGRRLCLQWPPLLNQIDTPQQGGRR